MNSRRGDAFKIVSPVRHLKTAVANVMLMIQMIGPLFNDERSRQEICFTNTESGMVLTRIPFDSVLYWSNIFVAPFM